VSQRIGSCPASTLRPPSQIAMSSTPSIESSQANRPHSWRKSLAASLRVAGRHWTRERPALQPASSALVFAPHPDDEVLGCGGTIALKAQAGARMQIVIMTDGRTSHAQFVDAATLVRMRHDEALAASARLGLQPSDYLFLDFEDGRLSAHAEAARERVAEILRRFEPDEVYLPHRLDRLPDHVATFEIVRAAVRSHGRPLALLEYPVWLWNTWPWSAARPPWRDLITAMPRLVRDATQLAFGCNTRVDIRQVLPRKLDALAQYRSQMQRQQDDPRWPVLDDVSDGTFLECFRTGEEIFRGTMHQP
jgi:LmbE family N-acetylglucosaminyl deacetylase